VLEEALDLLFDRLLMMIDDDDYYDIQWAVSTLRISENVKTK
jgi:hypothetical protein